METIKKLLAGGMTAGQIRKALAVVPDDAVVVFSADYGDISHTEQVFVVKDVDEVMWSFEQLVESSYSATGVAIRRVPDEEYGGEEAQQYEALANLSLPPVVLLRKED